VALLAASAIMAEVIPPCLALIILGFVANLSIGGCSWRAWFPPAYGARLDGSGGAGGNKAAIDPADYRRP